MNTDPDGLSDIQGQTIIENGQQYFIHGKTRIKITEHFSPSGKSISDLVVDLICHKNAGKIEKSA